ncbi:MAG: hypothetical protein FWD60_04665 [Candidatus Azobacteroides sp.]|nr:hypothetical protein [Candidatus Azobacteroides sp.]
MKTTKFYTLKEYADKTNLSTINLIGKSRICKLSIPRQVYWYYLFANKIPLVEICKEFNRTHSTIIYGIENIKGLIEIKDKIINPYLEALDIFSY